MVWAEALVSFFAMALLINHLSARTMRRLVGYKGWVDLVLHGTVLTLFFNTSTEGLIQAEAAAILFSVWLRVYAWALGYEKFIATRRTWVRYTGRFT